METFKNSLNFTLDEINNIVEQHGLEDAKKHVDDFLNEFQRSNLRGHIRFEDLPKEDHVSIHLEASKFAERLYGSSRHQFLMRMSRDVRCKLDFMSDQVGVSKSKLVEMLIKRVDVDFFGGRNVG
jgi:hypothetical protein